MNYSQTSKHQTTDEHAKLTKYKYPFVCCDFEPQPLNISLDEGFTYGNVVKIITNINDQIKKIFNQRNGTVSDNKFDYYDKVLSEINESNYFTEYNLLFYLFANDKIRIRLTFGGSESGSSNESFYKKTIVNDHNMAAKIMFIYLAVNSKKYKSISFGGIDQLNKTCKHITVEFYYASPSADNYTSPGANYTTTSYYDTLVIAKTVLNKNSMEILGKSNFDILRKMLFSSSFSKLNFILDKFNKLPFIDREYLMAKHGFISWALGVRNFDDIDMNIFNVYSPAIQEFLTALREHMDVDIIAAIPGSNYIIRNYQYAFLSKKYLGVANTYNYIFDPNAYGYIFGIKVFNVNWHMNMRYLIGRPKDCSEILYFNETTKSHFPVPPIPETKLTFKMKDSKSYHTHSMIHVMEKYGINDAKPEIFENAETYYMAVMIAKSYKFVTPLYWSKHNMMDIYGKYADSTLNKEFIEFVDNWDLPDSMIKMSIIKDINTSNSIIDNNSLVIDIIKQLQIQKPYMACLGRFILLFNGADVPGELNDIELIDKLSGFDLKAYELKVDDLKKIESNKPVMPELDEHNEHPLGPQYALLKEINRWKSYYDKSIDFVNLIRNILTSSDSL